MTNNKLSSYKKLKPDAIEILKSQGCYSNNWGLIKVVEDFDPKYIKNVTFIGENSLGANNKKIINQDGLELNCGIYNSTISNCIIKNNVYINNTRLYISKYIIEENVIIDNISLLATTQNSYFGNGNEINVLNEAGGREMRIFNDLSAHMAYLIVCYRQNKKFIKKINSIIDTFSEAIKSDTGIVSRNTVIQNCGSIRNMNIGEYSEITGASLLENGTITSCKEDPCTIGENVIARNFILKEGSIIDDGAIIHDCFIGQGCQLGKQISAEQSLFFANSEAYHGEFLSAFAGPYTVSHHKSSLLIAGMYSFYNAGSGTNKSNHMYRLGPVHQGILERGCKTGSFSYLIWPSHIGAFTSVIGKHSNRFDSSMLPFSYISEKKGISKIIPGVNYFSVGTKRDGVKWPNRDRRKTLNKTDHIIYDVLSPFTIQKVINGLFLLNGYLDEENEKKEFINHNGINIKVSQLENYCFYYDMILNKYIGDKLLNRLSDYDFEAIFKQEDQAEIGGKWIDIAGLIAPEIVIDNLMEDVVKDVIINTKAFEDRLKSIYDHYENYEWTWIIKLLENKLQKKSKDFGPEVILQIIKDWKIINKNYTNLVLKDAEKEFNTISQIGYGLGADESAKEEDFNTVRGDYESNSFVKQLKSDLIKADKLADKILSSISN